MLSAWRDASISVYKGGIDDVIPPDPISGPISDALVVLRDRNYVRSVRTWVNTEIRYSGIRKERVTSCAKRGNISGIAAEFVSQLLDSFRHSVELVNKGGDDAVDDSTSHLFVFRDKVNTH
jgi:hypothetical protein